MSFEDARVYLDSLGVDLMRSRGPSLARIEALCEVLNHPERAQPAIHITGTNGKTSTARIATSLLVAMGLSVGTFTSPHLVSVTERIAHSGDSLSESDFGDVFDHIFPFVEEVERRLGEKLSYFELLTGMFYLWAAEAPVDVMVVEVGLGGRWDATNVIAAPVAVITNIGLDHAALLGMERTTVAREKAGIIKEGSVVVMGERTPDVLDVITHEATEARSGPVVALDRDFFVADNKVALGGRYLSIRTTGGNFDGMFLPLHGSHQGLNAACALEAVLSLLPAQPIDRDVVLEGFSTTAAPGRLEVIAPQDEGGPSVVLDVAHNPEGTSALVSSLTETFAFDRVLFVIGVLTDKDHEGILSELARLPASLVVTQPKSVRSVPPDELKVAAEKLGLHAAVASDVADGLAMALRAAHSGELVCVTGSHYVVGEARSALIG